MLCVHWWRAVTAYALHTLHGEKVDVACCHCVLCSIDAVCCVRAVTAYIVPLMLCAVYMVHNCMAKKGDAVCCARAVTAYIVPLMLCAVYIVHNCMAQKVMLCAVRVLSLRTLFH